MLGLDLERLAIAVQRARPDAVGARDRFVDAGYGQTAFLEFLLAFPGKDFRVDEHLQPIARLRDINNNKAPRLIDLLGGAGVGRDSAGCGVSSWFFRSDRA